MGALQDERNQIYLDMAAGKKPTRIPITMNVNNQAALEYFGGSVLRDSYSPEKLYEAADKMNEQMNTDSLA